MPLSPSMLCPEAELGPSSAEDPDGPTEDPPVKEEFCPEEPHLPMPHVLATRSLFVQWM